MKLMKPALAIATLSVAVSAYGTRASEQTNQHRSMHSGSSQHYTTKQGLANPRMDRTTASQEDSQQERAYRTEQEVQAGGDYGVDQLSQNENQRAYTTQQEIAHGGEYGPGADRSVAAVEPAFRTQQDIANGVTYEAFRDDSNIADESVENEENYATTQQETVNSSENFEDEEMNDVAATDLDSDSTETTAAPTRSIASEKSDSKAGTMAATTGAATTTTHSDKADKKAHKDMAKKDEAKDMKADNSGQNKRDQAAGAMTADDQSNNKADVEVTRKIRAELMNKESLSTYAKNVKILVSGKEVVLRGPVRTEDEKSEIAKVASSIATNYQIKNELEIAKK